MGQFKGTSGKWVLLQTEEVNSHLDIAINTEEKDFHCICWVYSKSDIKNLNGKANALLISKAPEMLEMLEEFVNEFDIHGGENDKIVNKAIQLIKSATEL